jgi:MarR family transcriptional regulator, organic hydroperoxide resistance regulator
MAKRARPETAFADFHFDSGIDYLIRNLRHEFSRVIQQELSGHDLYIGSWFALRSLAEEDGMTLRELGKKLGLIDATIGMTIESLEQRGLIRRVRNAEDRRKINVFVTDKGRKVAAALNVFAKKMNSDVIAGFSDREVETFKGFLLRAQRNLSKKPS